MSDVLPPTGDPEPGWSQSLATGAPGIALLHVELARCGLGEWSTVQHWASATMRHEVSTHPSASLFRGAPAVAFAVQAAERDVYAATLAVLDGQIRRIVEQRLAAAHDRIDEQRPPALAEFDLISGLTGLGVYLLRRGRDHAALRGVLQYLTRLTEPLMSSDGPVPGWWTAHGPQDVPSLEWVGGHGNFGMAHGITGPLALLSSAMRRGTTVAGQPEAIDRVCTWLNTWRRGTAAQPWWPEMISLGELRSGQSNARHPHRPSWCYGVPGIARAMQLAGLALADEHRRRSAEDALTAVVSDGLQLNRVTDASLCHGWAGLALTAWRVAADSPDPHRLTERMPYLIGRLDRHLRDYPVPGHGLLEGVEGINLAQQSITRTHLPLSRWDACLLLDG
ncbi:lanthionine synthetase C family protein [Catellatospora methionotrophica]|uniref:lanthionine synthetase C family protein n=1 Tax=Catellatospora methionotrophica TaxID=121620 RepID=UPI0033D498B5